MRANYVLVYYTTSRYFSMRRQHIELFETEVELRSFVRKHKIPSRMYKIFKIVN
jgi:hypothetical protein